MREQDNSAAKHARILQAAVELFTERDFHQVLMDDVATRADVGKGTVYRYFPTKEELYFATIFEGWDQLGKELEAVVQQDGPQHDLLEQVTRQVLSYFWQRRQFVTLVHRLENNLAGEEQADWQRRRDSIVGVFSNILNKGLAAHALSSGQMRLVTEMYLGMLRSIVLYHKDQETPDTMTPLAVHLFLDGLSNLTPSLKDSQNRQTAGGKSRVRATVRRATALN
ncbi:MAG: TetR/AcrR family transcriptional regulator [Deltaproteobacteria bacterium]|nr:TetR/AcrR family transcriptional regulator [Deltaproteobacteria bacterium]